MTRGSAIFIIALLAGALPQAALAQRMDDDVTAVFARRGLQSNAACVAQIGTAVGASFAARVSAATKALQPDSRSYYECAFTATSDPASFRAALITAVERRGYSCQPWKKSATALFAQCHEGQAVTAGYWALLDLHFVTMSSGLYSLLIVGIESNKIKR